MKFEFNNLKEPVYSQDFFYDLTIGGYINPFEMLKDKNQAEKVEEAVKLVKDFLDKAERAGILENI